MTQQSVLVDKSQASRTDVQSLKKLWALCGRKQWQMGFGIVCRLAQSMSLGVCFAGLIWVVTRLMTGEDASFLMLLQICGLVGLSLVGQMFFGYLSVRFCWLTSYEITSDLRLSVLDHLRHLPMGFHLSKHQGDLVTTLTSDMNMIESFLSDSLPKIAQALGLPLVVFLYLLTQDWLFAICAFSSVVLAVPIFLWASRRLSVIGIERQDAQAEAAVRLIEYVQGMAVVKSFNRIAQGQESFKAALDDFRNVSIQLVLKLTVPLMSVQLVTLLGIPFVILVAGQRFVEGGVAAGTIVATLVLLFSIYTPLQMLVSVMEIARIADASLSRLERVLDSQPLEVSDIGQKPQGFEVVFDKVSFDYDKGATVLKEVSFVVPERTLTAIVGPSGAGKSTVLNLIPRFWEACEGRVLIGGVDIRQMTPQTLNGLVTMVFQDVYLFSGTLRDNIRFGKKDATDAEVVEAAQAAQAHHFIDALPDGYDTMVGEGGVNLSGGERQRLSIARAILKDAPIVLLDEATAAVDPTTEKSLRIALAKLSAGKTMIVVAHNLSTIQAADQIVVLEKGQIVECGRHVDLQTTGGLYSRFWALRCQATEWKLGNSG